jgi:hypothetical protein
MTADQDHDLPHVDVHQVVLELPIEEAWDAVNHMVGHSFLLHDGHLLARVLGPEPRQGFYSEIEDRPTRLVLRGRHHFSTYRLSFVLEPVTPSTTCVRAITDAAFPGWQGSAYRAIVIGTGAHARIVQRILDRMRKATRSAA